MTEETGKRPAGDQFPAGRWRSFSTEGSCVEVNHHPHGWVGLRDSKHPTPDSVLVFHPTEWRIFVRGIQ